MAKYAVMNHVMIVPGSRESVDHFERNLNSRISWAVNRNFVDAACGCNLLNVARFDEKKLLKLVINYYLSAVLAHFSEFPSFDIHTDRIHLFVGFSSNFDSNGSSLSWLEFENNKSQPKWTRTKNWYWMETWLPFFVTRFHHFDLVTVNFCRLPRVSPSNGIVYRSPAHYIIASSLYIKIRAMQETAKNVSKLYMFEGEKSNHMELYGDQGKNGNTVSRTSVRRGERQRHEKDEARKKQWTVQKQCYFFQLY